MLRIAQVLIGVVFILISSRLIHSLEGQIKLFSAILFSVILGYYFVSTNVYILKRSGGLIKALGRRLEPHKSGHAILLCASVLTGYGYSENHKVIIWLGLGGIFFANYLLTIVRSPFDEICMELRREDRARRTKEIEITVSQSPTSNFHYLITIGNKSAITLRNIRIFYEPFILDAENFGIDTTHMPSKDALIHEEPIFIESLGEKEIIKFERKGWGAQETYVGQKECPIEIGFLINGETPDRKDRKWCLAKMALPNARNG